MYVKEEIQILSDGIDSRHVPSQNRKEFLNICNITFFFYMIHIFMMPDEDHETKNHRLVQLNLS